MCISPDFLNSAEYVIPAGASIYPDLAFTDSLILLPYTGGDKSMKTICAFMDCNIENSSCGKDCLEALPLINLIS